MILEPPNTLSTCPLCLGQGSIRSAEVKFREAVTTVPCPVCERCSVCGGTHVVTPTRAAELRKAEGR